METISVTLLTAVRMPASVLPGGQGEFARLRGIAAGSFLVGRPHVPVTSSASSTILVTPPPGRYSATAMAWAAIS